MIHAVRGEYALLLVGTELHPFARGGIGVLNANLMKAYAAPAARVLYLNVGPLVRREVFRPLFPHCDVVNAYEVLKNVECLPEAAFSQTSAWHYRSYLALQALVELLSAGVAARFVEFPDYGGLGGATLLARGLHPVLDGVDVTVRCHGPETVLRRYAGRAPWADLEPVMDLERQAYAACDRVVVHVPAAVQVLADALALGDLGARAVVQRPPVGQANGVPGPRPRPAPVPEAVFASKLDPVKRPEVFLGAAHLLAAQHPAAPVRCSVLADALPGQESAVADVVASLRSRDGAVRWLPGLNQRSRRDVLARSAVVVPGPFEAFCLLAYEVALLGGRPVLNRENPAFGESSAWRDGENCWTFDGTADDLARVLAAVGGTPLPRPLEWRHDATPYWLAGGARPAAPRAAPGPGRSPGAPGSVAVVVTHRDLEEFVGECLGSLARQSRPPAQVVVVDDGSVRRGAVEADLDALAAAGVDCALVASPAPVGLARSRAVGLARVDADYVCFLDADDLLQGRFLERAAGALDRHGGLDGVVPFAGCFVDPSQPWLGASPHVLSFLGATYFGRYVGNYLASATALVRTAAMRGVRLDPALEMYEDWDAWCQLAEAGARLAVDHRIGLWYRQRPDSMSARGRGTAVEQVARDRVRVNAWRRGAGMVPAMVLSDVSGAPAPPPAPEISAQVAAEAHALRADNQALRVEAEALRAAVEALVAERSASGAELRRLARVEAEAREVLGRRALRLAMQAADARHRLLGRRAGRGTVFGG